jgi:beta-mannosidase
MLLWNYLDGWPQFSEALVDFYFDKKPGFTTVSRSYEPLLVTVFENNDSQYQINVINDTLKDQIVNCKIYDADSKTVYFDGEIAVDKNSSVKGDVFSNIYFEQKCLVIEYVYDGKKCLNHFITGYPCYKKEDFVRWYKLLGILK